MKGNCNFRASSSCHLFSVDEHRTRPRGSGVDKEEDLMVKGKHKTVVSTERLKFLKEIYWGTFPQHNIYLYISGPRYTHVFMTTAQIPDHFWKQQFYLSSSLLVPDNSDFFLLITSDLNLWNQYLSYLYKVLHVCLYVLTKYLECFFFWMYIINS